MISAIKNMDEKLIKKHRPLKYQKATLAHARGIHVLVNSFAHKNRLLPRSLNDIYELIRDFYICLDKDKIIAACSLHIVWEDLAEIRSLAVMKKYQRRGIGNDLVDLCLKEAVSLGINKVFALTYYPEFFHYMGFEDIDKNELPHKIWGDCLKCPKFPGCEEVAVIKKLGA